MTGSVLNAKTTGSYLSLAGSLGLAASLAWRARAGRVSPSSMITPGNLFLASSIAFGVGEVIKNSADIDALRASDSSPVAMAQGAGQLVSGAIVALALIYGSRNTFKNAF